MAKKQTPEDLYRDDLSHFGKVTSVQKSTVGSALSATTSAGVTSVISVYDTSDFNEDGGSIQITGDAGTSIETYSAGAVDDDALTITLDGTTTFGNAIDDDVNVYPLTEIYNADVTVEDDESLTIVARIPYPMIPFFQTGVRDDDESESVIIELRGMEWVVNDIIGEEPSLVADPDTGWVAVMKQTTESITSDATYSNDAELFFDVDESTTYIWRAHIFFTTASALADFKCDWSTPSSAVKRFATFGILPGGSGIVDVDVNSSNGEMIMAGPSTGTGSAWIEGRIVVDAASTGTVYFRWAQNTSNAAATTVMSGSYIEYRKVQNA